MARMLPVRLAVVAVMAMLGLTAQSQASTPSTAQRADLIMREVTAQMTHGPSADGEDQDGLPVDELVALYDRGEQLYIQCGFQAEVAQAILARNGIRSRIINTLAATGAWDDEGDGHMFLEIWTGRRWIAYDPDGNRQPVHAQGHAIGALQYAHTRPFHWRYIATDPLLGAYHYSYAQLDRDVSHAMGIVAIQTTAPDGSVQFAYHVGPALRARVENYRNTGWTWVGKKRWAQITRGGEISEQAPR
jgi:Transglutaminase-like superfamily